MKLSKLLKHVTLYREGGKLVTGHPSPNGFTLKVEGMSREFPDQECRIEGDKVMLESSTGAELSFTAKVPLELAALEASMRQSLSDKAKAFAMGQMLSSHPSASGAGDFDAIMENSSYLDTCTIWEPFSGYDYDNVADWLQELAMKAQELIDG